MNEIKTYQLTNNSGMSVKFINLGGAIIEMGIPVKGQYRNVVVAYPDLSMYEENPYYLGIIVGPIAGRVPDGVLRIGDKIQQLTKNTQDGNHIHGGDHGFGKAFWTVEVVNQQHCILRHRHVKGTDGYDANIDIFVEYSLSDDNVFKIIYHYKSDADTYVNPTNHSYFNLLGSGNILDHHLIFHSKSVLAIDENSIPRGEYILDDVFSFKDGKQVSDFLSGNHEQVRRARGLDHPFVLESDKEIVCSVSDLKMIVKTTAPAVVIYTGNYLENSQFGLIKNQGICFETQEAPNASNLGLDYRLCKSGEELMSETSFGFIVDC